MLWSAPSRLKPNMPGAWRHRPADRAAFALALPC